jgi:hypothetical protein
MADTLPATSGGRGRDVPSPSFWHGIERLKARRALRAARSAADDELLIRETPPLRLAWRVEELVAPKSRLDLAHTLRSVVRDAGPRYLPGASPVNRLAVRPAAETLHMIADRLADLDRPVAGRGILMLERLLIDGSGPLYDRDLADELPLSLVTALAALEPR